MWQGRKAWRSCQEVPFFIYADGKREDGEDSELHRAHGTPGFSFTLALGG